MKYKTHLERLWIVNLEVVSEIDNIFMYHNWNSRQQFLVMQMMRKRPKNYWQKIDCPLCYLFDSWYKHARKNNNFHFFEWIL